MKPVKPILFTLFLIILILAPEYSFSQCTSKFQVKKINNKDIQTGQLEIKVLTSDTYSGTLSIIEGTSEKIVKTFMGRGDTNNLLDFQIKDEALYRIVISFNDEKDFLCKKKVKIIDPTDSQ